MTPYLASAHVGILDAVLLARSTRIGETNVDHLEGDTAGGQQDVAIVGREMRCEGRHGWKGR